MKKILLLLLSAGLLHVATAAEQPDTDSMMRFYYARGVDHIRKPEIIGIGDTLLRLSIEQRDLNMQSTALVFMFDYYYSCHDLDSMKAWLGRIEHFARKNNELKPLYFAQNQLITYYIAKSHYTLAQYELEKLLVQAEKDNYKIGIAQAYSGLGNIYMLREVHNVAIDYYYKAIDCILQNELDTYLLSTMYRQLSSLHLLMGDYKKALETLAESGKYNRDERSKYFADGDRAVIYAQNGETKRALALLSDVEANRPPYMNDTNLYNLRMKVYKGCKLYDKALIATEALIDAYKKADFQESYYADVFANKAEILAALGHKERAYDELAHYIQLYKEKISRESENTLGEFATLMGVDQLNREKVELEHDRIRAIVGGLLLILLLALTFIFLQMRTNRRLRNAKRVAEEANRMKGEFIRHITHEVNTPLNSIIGFSELAITTPESDPERQGYVDLVHENSDYLQKLIDDTLYISDLEASDEGPMKMPADITECCHHALRNVAHLQKPEVTVAFRTQGPVPASVPPQYVIKVTTELLRNALSFVKEGSIELTAEASHDGKQIAITVTDTGCGIPLAEAEHIFNRFVKLNAFSQGLGLGLAVCRMIAHSMEGDVRLDTTYTKGARFIFTFPAA